MYISKKVHACAFVDAYIYLQMACVCEREKEMLKWC